MASISETSSSQSQASVIFEIQETGNMRNRVWETAFKTGALIGGLAFVISGAALAAYFCPQLVTYSNATFYTATIGLPVSSVLLSVCTAGVILAKRQREIEEFESGYKTVEDFYALSPSKQLRMISHWMKKQIQDARDLFEYLKVENSDEQYPQITFLPNIHGSHQTILVSSTDKKTQESQWQVYTEILSILSDLPEGEKLYIFSEDMFYNLDDPDTITRSTYDQNEWPSRYGYLYYHDQKNKRVFYIHDKPSFELMEKAKDVVLSHLGKFGAPALLKFQRFPVELMPTVSTSPLEHAMMDELMSLRQYELNHKWFNDPEKKKLFHEFISYTRELRPIKKMMHFLKNNPDKKVVLIFGQAHDFTTYNADLPLEFIVPEGFSIEEEKTFTGFSRKGVSYSDWQEQNPL